MESYSGPYLGVCRTNWMSRQPSLHWDTHDNWIGRPAECDNPHERITDLLSGDKSNHTAAQGANEYGDFDW
jgi:hypothetical protein